MNLFKKLFGKSEVSKPNVTLNIDELLRSNDLNHSIIEFDNYICGLCKWGDEIDKLTLPQKNFYYNQNLEREINNGGFHQYFSNSSGDFAHETIVSLRGIGAIKTATILQQAIDKFPDCKVPHDRDQRQNVLEQIEDSSAEKFEELYQSFFKYEDDLNTMNIEYIRKHKDKF
jgi:hypothetical protein